MFSAKNDALRMSFKFNIYFQDDYGKKAFILYEYMYSN